MAITLRNQRVETLIREIGRRTGEGPSAVIARAVETLANPEVEGENSDFDHRFKELMDMRPPRDPKLTWADLEAEMDSIF